MDFSPFLGWVDVLNPSSPPAGARKIGASDLLRYENALSQAAQELGLLNDAGQRGYTVSQAAGRTVTVWDYLNNREQMIYGDTGWRKVDATLPVGITASNVWLRRQGNEVTINVQNLRAETVGTVTVYNASLGYRPDAPSVRSGVFASSAGTARIVSPFGSNVRVLSMGAGESLDGSVTFATLDPWPTTLPGVAA